MNYDYAIESLEEQINNHKTKEYFKEVYQTYINGNYRSSMVMLYSVIICDLVFKLRDLRDVYKDSKAGKIITEIEDMQLKDPKSPLWESKLIEEIQNRTNLLETSDIANIIHLQQLRHLSAHPVLSSSDILFTPNKETTKAAIKNTLESILTKPPFFSNKIFDSFISDLEYIKDKLTEKKQLQKYLESRYFNQLKNIDFQKILRSLWKVTFVSEDASANSNREINLRALALLIQSRREVCIEAIKIEKAYYSKIGNNDDLLIILINLLARVPEIYQVIEPALIQIIEGKTRTDDNAKFVAWYLKPSLKEHLESLIPSEIEIDLWAFQFMNRICVDQMLTDELYTFIINYFGTSRSYDQTREIYSSFIQPLTDEFTKEHILLLLSRSNSNSQIYDYWGMKSELRSLVRKRFEGEIEMTEYKNII